MDEKDILRRLKEDGEQIEAPAELQPEQIGKMLESVRQMQDTWREEDREEAEHKRWTGEKEKRESAQGKSLWAKYGRRIAAAAVVVLGVGALYGTGQLTGRNFSGETAGEENWNLMQTEQDADAGSDTEKQKDGSDKVPGTVSVARLGDLYTRAPDYEAVYDRLESAGEIYYKESTDEIGNSMEELESDTNGSADGVQEHSATNLMTEGVDESDLVRTDGNYIYMVEGNRVTITDIRKGVFREVASIRPPVDSASGSILELYVDGDQLLVIVQQEETEVKTVNSGIQMLTDAVAAAVTADDVYQMDSAAQTVTCLYDITDPKEPKLEESKKQDGVYRTSRKIGDILYVFTDYTMELPGEQKEKALKEGQLENWVPSVDEAVVPADCIYLPEKGNQSLIISSLDVTAPKQLLDVKMIVSDSVEVYVSNSSIFLYGTDYNGSGSYTRIAKFSMNKGRIEGTGAASVKGIVRDPFAINEYQGYLRVLTTDWTGNSEENAVYVLDSELHSAGELTGIAAGEEIYSARFLKNVGYFVTYRNTDPLFTVDFTDPANPRLLGELKVTGFSEYLHFWGEDKLLGIGYETDPADGRRSGLKLSMFDISDPEHVKEESRLVLEGMDESPALYDYKCVLADEEKNLIGLAMEDYDSACKSYHVYSYENGSFVTRMTEPLEEDANLLEYRGLYAGACFYLAGNHDLLRYDMGQGFRKSGTEWERFQP